MKHLLLAFAAFFGGPLIALAANASTNLTPSTDYSVSVSGHPIPVRTALVFRSPPVSFAGFDLNGSAAIVIESTHPVKSAQILPASAGIQPTVPGSTIRFTLTRPRNLTVEINGSPARPLHLFANPPETDIPKPTDSNVLYFGPGVHEIGTLALRDGATLYLAEGAILRGIISPNEKPLVARDWCGLPNYRNFIEAGRVGNVKICGRGIIDLGNLPWHSRNAMVFSNASNVTIEGITIIGSPCWDVALFGCTNVHIRDIKEICSLSNSDGIDICNSQDVTVEGCFLRNNDDEICVKTTAPPPAQPSRNIVVRNCVVWNDRARGLGITNETRRDIDNVVFRDCDIIHDFSTSRDCAALAVIIDDSGTISNVRFEDIRINDVKIRLIHCWIGKEMWGHDADRGHLNGVTFKDITVTGDTFPVSDISGYDEKHLIENVTLDNVAIQGKPVSSAAAGRISVNQFVRNLSFVTNYPSSE